MTNVRLFHVRNSYGQWDVKPVNDNQTAQYLQFYDIGSDLVQDGDVPLLKCGKRSDTEAVLLNYFI